MPKEAIFIGATIAGAPDGARYFGPVKIPGNMSKPATITAHQTKIEEERAAHLQLAPTAFADSVRPNGGKYENHAHRPMTGVLASVEILDHNGDPLYQQTAETPERGKVALPVINYLKEQYPRQFSDSLRYGDVEPSVIIFGFNIKQVLRIAAFEVLGRNSTLKDFERTRVPVRMWSSPSGVVDPLDVLISKDDQRDLDLYSALRYFNILVDKDSLAANAKAQAHYVKNLVTAAQLMPMTVGN